LSAFDINTTIICSSFSLDSLIIILSVVNGIIRDYPGMECVWKCGSKGNLKCDSTNMVKVYGLDGGYAPGEYNVSNYCSPLDGEE
jgi:hypothetical protein